MGTLFCQLGYKNYLESLFQNVVGKIQNLTLENFIETFHFMKWKEIKTHGTMVKRLLTFVRWSFCQFCYISKKSKQKKLIITCQSKENTGLFASVLIASINHKFKLNLPKSTLYAGYPS